MINFYVDGSCKPSNPGPGAFGVIGIKQELNSEETIHYCYSEHFDNTTNNRMELLAILHVMEKFGHYIFDQWGVVPRVYSDSAYAVNTFTNWMFNWARNGWTKSDKKTPENLDLIKAYYDWYQKGYRIDIRKVKGHNGNKWNEIVDQLATGKITKEKVEELYGK